MKTLLMRDSEVRLLPFLEKHKARIELLCEPGFVADLFYCRRYRNEPIAFDFPLETLTIEAMDKLARRSAEPGLAPLHIVAAPADERGRVAALQADYPELRFVGLAERVVPAIVAQAGHMTFEAVDETAALPEGLKAAVLIATPRSGSSYVCDIMASLGIGRPKEHLRDPIIELFASGYRFDKARAIRNFVRFSARNGWVGTKLITHFLDDFASCSTLTELDAFRALGLPLYPILLDREDRVLQAISGELAARRGVWHVTDEGSKAKIEARAQVPYNFFQIFKRYLAYETQSACLNSWAGLFQEPLFLSYERDVADRNGLIATLGDYLGVDPASAQKEQPSTREKIASAINDEFRASFTADFEACFGVSPCTSGERGVARVDGRRRRANTGEARTAPMRPETVDPA